MTTLDEQALRLPNFDAGGEQVRLSDGQIWTLRTPRIAVEAVVGGQGTTLVATWRLGGSAEVEDLFERLMLARVGFQGSHADHYLEHVFNVAILQLQANYSLPRYEAHMLLMPRESDTPEEVVGLMVRVATAAVNRPFELLQAAQARLPYSTPSEYRQVDPAVN